VLYDPREGGPPAAACWTPGDAELFLATRQGRAIRFSERQVPVRGCLGMRVDRDDAIVGVAAVPADGGVFMATDDGKGTIRLMSGFSANKSPGASGKVGMKTDTLLGIATAQPGEDFFLISRLGKIIRFAADEVPAKDGVVQGVNCMNLRADSCVAMTAGGVAG
jgi:DNA gyrase subunit A